MNNIPELAGITLIVDDTELTKGLDTDEWMSQCVGGGMTKTWDRLPSFDLVEDELFQLEGIKEIGGPYVNGIRHVTFEWQDSWNELPMEETVKMLQIEILQAYRNAITRYEVGKSHKEMAIEDAYFHMEV